MADEQQTWYSVSYRLYVVEVRPAESNFHIGVSPVWHTRCNSEGYCRTVRPS